MAIKDYLVLDMAKPANTFVNLSDYFQGRVGDAEAYCKLWIKFGTRPIDMTDKKLRFEGNDPNNTPFIDAGRFDAGDDGDVQKGMITFYFPKGIFQVEGKWIHAFFKLQTEDGKDISSADLTLNVFPNNVEMGIGIHPFESDLEKVKAQINDALREMNAQQLLNQIDSMKTTVGAYTDLIQKNAVLNKPQTIDLVNGIVNPLQTDLTGKMNSLSANLNNQMTTLNSNVQSSIENNKVTYQYYTGTMINGCTGWCNGVLIFIQNFAIGFIFGWAHFPEKSWKNINFATNPLASKVDFSNLPAGQTIMVTPAGKQARRSMRCAPDSGSNFQQIGLWNSNDDYNTEIYDPAADTTFEFSFFAVPGQLKK